jgi:hypothetical protein
MVKAVITFNIICRIEWSGRPELHRGPPAPKPDGLSFLSPSLAPLFLKTKDLAKNLVVGRSTKMWLGTRKVPRISKQRKSSSAMHVDQFASLRLTGPTTNLSTVAVGRPLFQSSVSLDDEDGLVVDAILFTALPQTIISCYRVLQKCIADLFCW